jgi:hypothetical protein
MSTPPTGGLPEASRSARGVLTVSYWKMLGDTIAKGLGEKTIQRLSSSGRFLGRTGAVVGGGFLIYELVKNYKENIENEPEYKEMMTPQAEMVKWTSAISCIGREPLEEKEFVVFFDNFFENTEDAESFYSSCGFEIERKPFYEKGRIKSIDESILEEKGVMDTLKFYEVYELTPK